jgi:hypothetical protein
MALQTPAHCHYDRSRSRTFAGLVEHLCILEKSRTIDTAETGVDGRGSDPEIRSWRGADRRPGTSPSGQRAGPLVVLAELSDAVGDPLACREGWGHLALVHAGGSCAGATSFKGALESGEVRVDASLDPTRRERPEHGCHPGQFDGGVEVDDGVGAVGGESVPIGERRRPRCCANPEFAGMLAGEDLERVSTWPVGSSRSIE